MPAPSRLLLALAAAGALCRPASAADRGDNRRRRRTGGPRPRPYTAASILPSAVDQARLMSGVL